MLPLVVGSALQGNRFAPVAMGAGMTVSFALIGMVLGALGPALGSDTVRIAGAAMLIAFAVVMLVPAPGGRFSQWMPPIASQAQNASSRLDGRTLTSALLLGDVLGLVWSPCSGPLLGSAPSLVASEGTRAARTMVAATLLLSCLLVQMPWMATLLHLKPLDVDDWALALGGGVLAGILAWSSSRWSRPIGRQWARVN